MKNILLLATFLVSLHSIAQVPSYVSPNGLVGYWPFNGNANDVSGNGNNGTVNGATLTTDRYGSGSSAYYFSATNCGTTANPPYIGANINTTSINTSGAMTLSFWIYRVGDGCQGPRVMEFGSCGTCAGQILVSWGNGNNPITFRHYLTTTNFITYNFQATASNRWYHIVYTNDGAMANYYLDGVLVNTQTSPAPVQLIGNAAFGRMNHPNYDAINGNLDDIGLWNRALTPCEINILHTEDPSTSFAYNALPDTTYICDATALDAGAGYSSYSWQSPDAALDPDANNQLQTVNQTGSYNVTVTNSSGCVAHDTTQVIVIRPSVTADNHTVCSGGAATLNAAGIATTSQTLIGQFYLSSLSYNQKTIPTTIGKSYVMTVSGIWSVHFCTDANNVADAAFYYQRNPISALPNNLNWVQWNGSPIRPDGDTYNSSHIYTYTTAPATQTTQTFTFVDPSDNASHTNSSAYTDNCDSLLFQVSQINKSTATYTWSANPAATAGLAPADINKQTLTVHPAVTTTYYVVVKDGIVTCEDSIKITVAHADTTLTVTGPTTVCSGNVNVLFTAAANSSYKWLLNNTPIPGAAGSTYTTTNTGVYSVAITNSLGCIDTSRTVTIASYPKPVAGFTINNTSQCLSNNSFVYNNTSTIASGTLSYHWDLGDGNKAISKDTTYSYTIANNSYSVKLISTSNNGCSDSITKTVVIKPTPKTPIITANGPLSFCTNGSVVLSSDTALGNQWYKDNAGIAGAVNQNYTANASGSYTVIATANGCLSNASTATTVTVTPTPSTPTATTTGSTSFCSNGNVLITSSSTSGNQWYKDAAIINGAINQTYNATATGSYTVIVTSNNCSSNTSNAVIVTISQTTPTPTITANGPLSFCDNGSVVLSSNAASGNQWYQSGFALPQATGTTYTASSDGVYTVTATAANECPSAASNGLSVSIIPSPEGIRYDALNVSANTPTVLQARNIGQAYTWIPSIGLSNSTTATPTFNNDVSTDYLIHIMTSSGCYTDDTVLVKVYTVKYFLIPTAFTPNGDGLNDLIKPFTIDIKAINYFRIFNKWGELLFESNNTANGWDGNYKGAQQAAGNYIWVAEGIANNGSIVTQHGQIILIR